MKPREIARNRVLVLILLVAFLGQSGLGILQSTFALYGEAVLFKGYSPEAAVVGVSLLLTVVGLGQFITQAVLLRPLLAKFGEHRLIVLGNIFRMLAAFIFAVAVTPWLGAIGSIIFAIGIGIMMPSLQSLATGTVGDEYRGGVLGIYQSTLSLSIIISSAIGGVLFAMSATMPYWVSGVIAVIALVPAIILLFRYGPKNTKTEPEVTSEPDKSSDNS